MDPSLEPLLVGLMSGILYLVFFLGCFLFYRYKRRKMLQGQAQQEQNIYNISGRVPGPNPPQYPDAFLSIDHISITTELNKPPKYDDSPPSYEEALKLAMAQSNSMQTLQAEQPQVHQSTTSTSSSTPVVIPAVPSRTTE